MRTNTDSAKDCLKRHWGFDDFRPLQREIIEELLRSNDVLAVLPTGAGKSLCYQVPGLLLDGICLVVSPLVALMEDQVHGLEKRGIRAMHLGGGLSREETITAFDNLLYGGFKFVYASPEKLQSELVQEKLKQLPVTLIAIDEAHCISQWGHDFRPSYLKLSYLKETFPKVPRIALTATATDRVEKDILVQLELSKAKRFRSSLVRDNLSIGLVKTHNDLGTLVRILQEKPETAIVYVGTRKASIVYAQHLRDQGISAESYHGGMDAELRSEALERWMLEETKIMVATNAFGMGIDKANVRCVIHCHVPMSLESYVQEVGRAGRDGKPAYAYLLFHEKSIEETKDLISKSLADPKFCREVYKRLNDHFVISHGEFRESVLEFDLHEFCRKYELPIGKTFAALGHLEREDVLSFDGSPKKTSRIRILEKPELLLQKTEKKNTSARVLQSLLRNYGGIHEQKINIQEKVIAQKLGIRSREVVKHLEALHSDGILSYDKFKGLSNMRFLVPREDNYIYRTSTKNIEARNKSKRTQLRSMQMYLENDRMCRNRQLVAYFGEGDIQDCGRCDICRKREESRSWEGYESASQKVFELLRSSGALDFADIERQLGLERKHLLKTIEMMVERKWIWLNLQNKFETKK